VNITSTIPSYVYTQYNDDANVSAFFEAYNRLSQQNLDEINGYQLPIYLNQSGALLDWAASSIYGVFRPTLSSGGAHPIGPYDTFAYNTERYDGFKLVNSSANFVADDVTYQRIIQWNTFKGDGTQFTMTWLKKRVERFLTGTIFPQSTYDISIRFTSDTDVLITVSESTQVFTGGALWNAQVFGGRGISFNQATTTTTTHSPSPLASAFKAAINSGILSLPFQYNFTVQI